MAKAKQAQRKSSSASITKRKRASSVHENDTHQDEVDAIEQQSTVPKKVKKFLIKEQENVKKEEIVYPNKLEDFIKDKKTIEILRSKNINYFFPIQEKCFQSIYDGKDLIGRDRTGSGKTLAFALPLIEKLRSEGRFKTLVRKQKPLVLVILPTRELTIQVTQVFKYLRHTQDEFRVIGIYGGTELRPQIDEVKNGIEVVVGTPGRLIDLYDRGVLQFEQLCAVVLDEADQMLHEQGFQEDIEKIYQYIKDEKQASNAKEDSLSKGTNKEAIKVKTQNLLFSATIPEWVHEIAQKFLDPQRIFIDLVKYGEVSTVKTVEHLAINCPPMMRLDAIGDVILCYGGGTQSRCIIFCETKREANDIMLKGNIKQEAQVLHGDIPQKQREITFQGFREGKFKCLIATNVASRGLDIPEVDLIVQCEPPKDVDTYVHRAGRTARAGRSGVCITFYSKKHLGLLERIEKRAKLKFKRVGAPQSQDILKASSRDISTSLKSVSSDAFNLFKDVAQDLIEEVGAEEALARALAFISGYTKKLKQRSLLCAIEGFVTIIVRTQEEFRSLGYIWNFLRKHFPNESVEKIKGMKRFKDNKGAAFDIAEEDKKYYDEYITKWKEGKIRMGNEIEIAQTIPELVEDVSQLQFTPMDHQKKEAFKNRKELELFIGGLSFNCIEQEISQFFQKSGVKFLNLRLLKDDQNNFKGVCFALCADQDSVKKGLALNGQRFGGRTLRINMANDKPNK